MEAVQWSISQTKGRIMVSHHYNTEETQEVTTNFTGVSIQNKKYTDAESARTVAGLQLQQYAYSCAEQITEKIKELMDPTAGMSDAEKKRYDQEVMAKVYAGKELTPEELRYIRMNYPALYPQVLRVQIQRKAFEERIKNCRSKQEVEDVFNEAMMRVSQDDPMCTVLYAAYTDVYEEFKETDAYEELPEKTEEEENKVSSDCDLIEELKGKDDIRKEIEQDW